MRFVSACLRIRAVFAIVSFGLILSACGGGGGGGSPAGGGGLDFGLSQSTVSVTANQDDSSVNAVSVTVSAFNGSVYFRISGYSLATLDCPGANTCTITVPLPNPNTLSAGTNSYSISVMGCSDLFCQNPLASSPKTLTVNYTINPGTAVSPQVFNFSAVEGTIPPAQNLTITSGSGSASWTSSIAYTSGSGWLTLTPANGGALPETVAIQPAAMSRGDYQAIVTLTNTVKGVSRFVIINYSTTSALFATPNTTQFNIGNTPAPADLKKQLIISSNYVNNTPNLNWSASVDAVWLAVAPRSGDTTTANVLTLDLVQAELDKLLNGTYTAMVTLASASPFVSSISIPVTLVVNRTQLNYVSPYVGYTNRSEEVILRGVGFSRITINGIRFGNVNASSFNVVSDTEIRATYPVLAENAYPVQIVSANGTFASMATLLVKPESNYSTSNVPSNYGLITRMFYDPERQSVLMLSGYTAFQNVIIRYHWNGSAWVNTSVTLPPPIIGVSDMALSPDGKYILAVSSSNIVDDHANRRKLIHLDASTLDVLEITAELINTGAFRSIAFANDGTALIASGDYTDPTTFRFYRYQVNYKTFSALTNELPNRNGVKLAASGDGSRIVIGTSAGGIAPPSGSDFIAFYSASDDTIMSASHTGATYNISLTRTGTMSILGSGVFDSTYNLIGLMPGYAPGFSCFYQSSVISLDGSRAYSYCGDRSVHTLDLLNKDTNGAFVDLGTTRGLADAGSSSTMIVSQDGKTIFVMGDTNFLIAPTPSF